MRALFWEKKENNTVRCNLCNHHCIIQEGKRGICGVRENRDGELHTLIYGLYSSVAIDPIEKKPLYHFYPGSEILSYGTVGCNFKCLHCQNYTISQANVENSYLEKTTPEGVLGLAKRYKVPGVAWTYNEPTIWYEFTHDCSKLLHEHGIKSVYVTNGYIEKEPLKRIAPYLDAMNIDVKGFTEEFYAKVVHGRLKPVLETCELAYHLGIHIEITYLVIPRHNDNERELVEFVNWVKEKLSPEVPVHFTRFHPDYELMDVPPTPLATLKKAFRMAKDIGLANVYIGNVWGEPDITYCPKCNEILIEREGFSVVYNKIKDGKCSKCKEKIFGRF
ncbi:MAG: AmmeMemoRadiSam system radical SAM enzyme [Thermoplasmata archaeon]|nr:AmmeMemoRadiSam system radical SAM enzyme [Thermoplasmata archaeon]